MQDMTRPRNLHLPATQAIESQPDTTTLHCQASGSGAAISMHTRQANLPGGGVPFSSGPERVAYQVRRIIQTHGRAPGRLGSQAVGMFTAPDTVTYQAQARGRAPGRQGAQPVVQSCALPVHAIADEEEH